MLTDELFMLSEQRDMTKASDLCTEAQNAAQKLLNQYVRVQGLQISQVILNTSIIYISHLIFQCVMV